MRSPKNETLENGSSETAVALGKAIRSDAGADGFSEARSNSPGTKTLKKDMLVYVLNSSSGNSLVNDVGNTVEQNVVGEGNAGVVDPGRTVGQDCESQVVALESRNCNVAQGRREDDSAGDDVVAEDLLEGLDVRRLNHRANRLESFICGHKDGEVGDVETLDVSSSLAKCEVELSSLQRAVHGEVASTVGEELKRGSKRKHRVDLVDGDALTQLDVLCFCEYGRRYI
jgi:hypothetical protein